MTGWLRISVAEEHTCSWECGRGHKGYPRGHHGSYDPPVIRVPASPNYSTPAEVTARCRERGTTSDADILAASRNTAFRRAWKAFRASVEPAPCPASDWHRPRWEYRWIEANGKPGHYERRRLTPPAVAWESCPAGDNDGRSPMLDRMLAVMDQAEREKRALLDAIRICASDEQAS